MGKSRPPSHGGAPSLSEEDRAAWEHAARALTPLRRARREPPAPPSTTSPAPAKPPARPRAPSSPAADPPPFAEIGRRQVRKLGAGRVKIDARVDLHGMRRDEAHGVLRAFLFGAQARGARWVLVITGKGAPRAPASASDDETYAARSSGVLRREVPYWLDAPDLKAIIVAFREAAGEHGGDGALYVHLRRPTRRS